MVSTDEGMQTECSSRHSSNADSPRIEILAFASNANFERFSQHLKHDLEMVSIDAGIQIGFSREQRSNADSPRVATLQPS
jgi:hypothetical protein